jgi:hypothetical protein
MDITSFLNWFEVGSSVFSLVWKIGVSVVALFGVWYLYKNYGDMFKKFWDFIVSLKK